MNAQVPNPHHCYPLSLGFLGTVIEEEGHEVEMLSFFNMKADEAEKSLVEVLERFNPDVVGFNCITQNRCGTYKGIEMVKNYNKDTVVVLGGVHATIMCDQLLDNFPIDYIIRGEGEIAIVELLETLDNKEKIRVGSRLVDMDSLPIADHSYAREWIEENGTAHLITSRGCPGNCIFCSSRAFWGGRVRFRSAKLVVDEIEYLMEEFGISDFLFHDDTFNFTIGRATSLSQEILDRNLNITWQCNARVHPVSKDMLLLMKQAGCTEMRFGVETGSDSIMQTLGKRITKEQIQKCFELCYEVGIDTFAFMMVGLPGETEETIQETVEFMETLTMAELPAVGLTYLYPGTVLYEICKKEGIIADDYWLEGCNDFVLTSSGSVEQLTEWAGRISVAPQIRSRDEEDKD